MPFILVKNLVKEAWSEKLKSSASRVMVRLVVFRRRAASAARASLRNSTTVRPLIWRTMREMFQELGR